MIVGRTTTATAGSTAEHVSYVQDTREVTATQPHQMYNRPRSRSFQQVVEARLIQASKQQSKLPQHTVLQRRPQAFHVLQVQGNCRAPWPLYVVEVTSQVATRTALFAWNL